MILHELTIGELTKKLASKEVSSREAMQACLDRIDEVDEKINAFISLDREDALCQADAADTALLMSSFVPEVTCPMSSSFAGLIISILSFESDSTHLPFI